MGTPYVYSTKKKARDHINGPYNYLYSDNYLYSVEFRVYGLERAGARQERQALAGRCLAHLSGPEDFLGCRV